MKKMLITMTAALWMSSAIAVNTTDKQDDPQCPPCHCMQGDMQRPHKGPSAEKMTERMTKELDLSKKQAEKVLKLNEEYKDVCMGPRHHGHHHGKGPKGKECQQQCPDKKVDGQTAATQTDQKPQFKKRPELTAEQKAQRKAEMEKRKVRKSEYDAKLKDILSKKQYEKYQSMRKKHHHPKGGPRPQE